MRNFIFLSIVLWISHFGYGQTMTFTNGASETGFTFTGWSAASGTIWLANLANPATVSKNSGTWDFNSFYVGPFVGSNNMQVTSNLGHSETPGTDCAIGRASQSAQSRWDTKVVILETSGLEERRRESPSTVDKIQQIVIGTGGATHCQSQAHRRSCS